jgi:pimeloyl-ACP methyl ester carboxylesterase
MSAIEDRASGELREGYAEIGDQRLHYVEAAAGPLIVLLHGLPEFWYGWREQIEPLAAAGFRVVAPDMRGYNLSSKPDGVGAYDVDQLTADIADLIRERGAESAMLAGHYWGGSVAWYTATQFPEVVDRLIILNAAHPRKLSQGLYHPAGSHGEADEVGQEARANWPSSKMSMPIPPSSTGTRSAKARVLSTLRAQGLSTQPKMMS